MLRKKTRKYDKNRKIISSYNRMHSSLFRENFFIKDKEAINHIVLTAFRSKEKIHRSCMHGDNITTPSLFNLVRFDNFKKITLFSPIYCISY